MVELSSIPTLAQIQTTGQTNKINNALLVELLTAVGGGGGSPLATEATVLAIQAAIVAQGTLNLNVEDTQLLIEANLDDLEELALANQKILGDLVDDTGFGAPITPAGTSFATSVAPAPDVITIADTSFDLRGLFVHGMQVRVQNSTSNNDIFEILDVTDQTILVPNGLLTNELVSGAETLSPKGQFNPLSLLGLIGTLRNALSDNDGTAVTNTQVLMMGIEDDSGNASPVFSGPASGLSVEEIVSAVADPDVDNTGFVMSMGADDGTDVGMLEMDATTRGLNTHIVSDPSLANAFAHLTTPTDSSGAELAIVANPTRNLSVPQAPLTTPLALGLTPVTGTRFTEFDTSLGATATIRIENTMDAAVTFNLFGRTVAGGPEESLLDTIILADGSGTQTDDHFTINLFDDFFPELSVEIVHGGVTSGSAASELTLVPRGS